MISLYYQLQQGQNPSKVHFFYIVKTNVIGLKLGLGLLNQLTSFKNQL